MESRAKLFGHPIHPMLIVFPLGLLSLAVIFDIIFLVTNDATFATVAFWNIAAGVIGGVAAAIFGLWDWLFIPNGTRAKAIGLWHGIGNATVLTLFAISWLLRSGALDNRPDALSLVLELVGVGLAMLTSWLGGEMVYRLNIGVDRGAHPDAPSSLSGEAARTA